MDYYSILGVNRGATPEEIKKAYRGMAMKHHPDRGGDEKKFKEISIAYEILSNPEKRQMFDAGMDPNNPHHGNFHHAHSPFGFQFNRGTGFDDLFGHFGFRPQRKNKSVNINIEITLEEVLNGKDIDAEITLPSGQKKIINISIPPGVDSGQQIRYTGMGDNSIQGIPPGDLIVSIFVIPHPVYKREGDSIIYEETISVWDALLGTKLGISTLSGKVLEIKIPPGTQPETIFSCRGEGIPNTRTKQRGNLMVRIKVLIPKIVDNEKLEKIRNLMKDL